MTFWGTDSRGCDSRRWPGGFQVEQRGDPREARLQEVQSPQAHTLGTEDWPHWAPQGPGGVWPGGAMCFW